MSHELTIEESRLFIQVPRRMRHVILRGFRNPCETQLNKTQFMTVMLLKEHGTVPMRFVASIIGMEKGSLTQVIDKLVALDMVNRRQDPEDRRSVLVELSPGGKRFADEIQRSFKAHLGETLDVLDGNEVSQLIESLNTIRKLVEKIEATKSE